MRGTMNDAVPVHRDRASGPLYPCQTSSSNGVREGEERVRRTVTDAQYANSSHISIGALPEIESSL